MTALEQFIANKEQLASIALGCSPVSFNEAFLQGFYQNVKNTNAIHRYQPCLLEKAWAQTLKQQQQ